MAAVRLPVAPDCGPKLAERGRLRVSYSGTISRILENVNIYRMPGWAGKLAEEIKHKEKVRREEAEREHERRKAYTEQGPRLFAHLVKVIQADVEEFNEVWGEDYKNRAEFKRFPAGGQETNRITVRRASYATTSLEVSFPADAETIEYRISRKMAHEGVPQEKPGKLKLQLNRAGVLYIAHEGGAISIEDLSQMLLKPVLSP